MDSRDIWRGVQILRGDPCFFYHPHGAQRRFHALGGEARERLFLAGNRVGKTLAGAAEVAFHLMGRYPPWWKGVRFGEPVHAWAASVTREATRDILQEVYMGRLRSDGWVGGVISPSVLGQVVLKGGVSGAVDTVEVRHASGGMSTLGFKSFDQGRASFQGTARHVVHLDEEPPLEVYEECLLRTLTVEGHMLLTMTPLMGMTDMVRHFVGEGAATAGKAVVRAGWAEAPHLKPQDLARLRASLRPHEVAARERGEPSLGSGRVFALDERDIACARFEIPPGWKWCFGLDFGWHNPTAAAWLVEDPASGVAYVVDVYRQSEATPAQHAEALKRRGAWVPGVCDPAGQAVSQKDGQSLVELYAASGVVLGLADNSLEAGLMRMLERFRAGTLKVFADLAPWWEEFRLYARDGKGKLIKRDDHLMDATRYALMSGLSLARTGEERSTPWVRPAPDWRVV